MTISINYGTKIKRIKIKWKLGAFKASRQRGTKQQEAGKFRSIRDRVQSIKFRVEDFKKGTWLPMLTNCYERYFLVWPGIAGLDVSVSYNQQTLEKAQFYIAIMVVP